MSWIEVHQALPTHRKLLDLADALNIKPVVALGHLVSFWLWALDNAPDGNLTRISKKTVAISAQWPRVQDLFMQAMISSGWFDDTEDGVKIHDWEDYAGRIMQNRADNKARMRNARARNVQSTNNERVGLPYPTVPYRTLSERETPQWLTALRDIPGWKERGKPHEESLTLWMKRKPFTEDDLERAAIGLGKVQTKTLSGYNNLARAFQDRLNKRYDLEETNDRKPGSRAEAIRREAEEQQSRIAR